MDQNTAVLCGTAAMVGLVHTVLGPDHYLPFVAMSRAGKWSLKKTTLITILCGVGHVLGSVVLGLIGIAFGVAVLKLENIESVRGDIAGWLLLAFGLAYFVWGVRRAILNRPHRHVHVHADGTEHSHGHTHANEHVHPHEIGADDTDGSAKADSMTPWILFTIFVFGPCEPLIPILMYPAAKGSVLGVILVALIFSVATITTMTTIVVLACVGIESTAFTRLRRYSHALAGFTILACGAAIMAGL
ncbi:MAG: hypothetical protein JSU63_02435 [Phycisphaerales bacterium]|nr:MAG: hypothetical protein JSU63_02435 [Phycisphaerales bacterium]